MSLGLSLLGESKFFLDGRQIHTISAEKAFALLVYLVVEADRVHHRETLAELFWPEKPEGFGRNSLKQALSQLRSFLNDRENHDPYLITSNRDLQFNTQSDFQLDVKQFEDLVRAASQHCPDEQPCCQECTDRLETAASLYRGEFLSDFYLADCPEFDEWVHAKREVYHRLQVLALSRLVNTFQEAGNYTKARPLAESLVELEPWNETSHRKLMRLLAASGKRSAALKQYHACEAMLASEFGVEPTPQTRQLYEEIKTWNHEAGSFILEKVQSKPAAEQPITRSQHASGLRRWVILTASLSILILVGIAYILFRPDRTTAAPSTMAVQDTPGEIELRSVPATLEEQNNPANTQEPPEDLPDTAIYPPEPGWDLTFTPDDACRDGEELIYFQDFQDEEIQEWPELYYQAQGWKIVSDPQSPENLAVYHTGAHDGKTELVSLIFKNSIFRIWIKRSGEGNAFLGWNMSSPLQPNEIEFQSYQMEIGYGENQLVGHAMYRVEWPVRHVTVAGTQLTIPENTWILYEVVQTQDHTAIRVNNELIVSFHDPYPLPPGNVGFEVFASEDPDFEIYFDRVSICRIAGYDHTSE